MEHVVVAVLVVGLLVAFFGNLLFNNHEFGSAG